MFSHRSQVMALVRRGNFAAFAPSVSVEEQQRILTVHLVGFAPSCSVEGLRARVLAHTDAGLGSLLGMVW